MGEHKMNARAVFKQMLPSLPMPPMRQRQVSFVEEVVPKPNVLVLPAERIRREGGKVEIFGRLMPEGAEAPTDEGWHALPEELRAYAYGEEIPPEDCDVVFMMASVWINTTIKLQAGYPHSTRPLMEICRVDYRTHVASHEGTLDGARMMV